ncbi:MAG TPA: hypothetical protein PKZ76_01595 [Xanthomonadaceae bacterium]|nr:hypothetical protein [Xanthomonadaceae bacterium]
MPGKLAIAVLAILAASLSPDTPEHPPTWLHDTGLYAAPGTNLLRAEVVSFSPQYPLWSDGARKRRWIALPPGAAIDASQPAAWEFPAGTRLWKEFSVRGRRVETRLIERLADGAWRFAAYAMYKHFNDEDLEAIFAFLKSIPAIINRVPEPLPPADVAAAD